MKKWECTVCGYIHEGDAPPAQCPVCGAGAEYFKEIEEDQQESLTEKAVEAAEKNSSSDPAQTSTRNPTGMAALVLTHHLHPIAVHSPNGVLPLAMLFLIMAMIFGGAGFETASFYNLVFVLLTLPVVIFTGYLEWQNRYRGAFTKLFVTKMGASAVITIALSIMVVWRFIDPQVAVSPNRWIYLLIGGVMLGAAVIAGHMGSKLVFGGRDR